MKYLDMVMASTEPSAYGTVFTPGGLWSGIESAWEHGLPSTLGHDAHRLHGWCFPRGVFFSPKRSYSIATGTWVETAEEAEMFKHRMLAALSRRVKRETEPHEPELRRRLEGVLRGDEKLAAPNCAALCGPGLAERAFPEFFADADADGLVEMSRLKWYAPGVFEANDLIGFAHPYFRRGQSRFNSLNEPFLAEFAKMGADGGRKQRIRLDPNLVGLVATWHEVAEYAYWWGPKFSDDLNRIPLGVTVHEMDEAARLINGIGRTEFWWYELSGRKTFECEELRNAQSVGLEGGGYGCRFVHTIVDAAGRPVHADGAIRGYDEDAMLRRMELDISKAGKKTSYTKLWRIDGAISVREWKSLVTQYYRDNELVGEYFGAPPDAYRENIKASRAKKKPRETKELVDLPSAEQGVQIAATIKLTSILTERIELRVLDTITQGKTTTPSYELDTLELLKLLQREGITVRLPTDAKRTYWTDDIVNLPVLVCRPADAGIVRRCWSELCAGWHGHGSDRWFTCNLVVHWPEAEVVFSYAGHSRAMVAWLASEAVLPPEGIDGMGAWSDRAHNTLAALFPLAAPTESEKIWRRLEPSGVIRFRRVVIPPDRYDSRLEEKGLVISARPLPKDKKAMKAAGVEPGSFMFVQKTTCRRCGNEYATCPCLKSGPLPVGETITDATLLGVMWSRRIPSSLAKT